MASKKKPQPEAPPKPKRRKRFITGPQRTHLVQRIERRHWSLNWESNNKLRDKQPPGVAAARKKVEAWDRRQREKESERSETLHTVTQKVMQFLCFEPPEVAIAVVEKFEAMSLKDILDPDVDVFEEVTLMAAEMRDQLREQRAGRGPAWDR